MIDNKIINDDYYVKIEDENDIEYDEDNIIKTIFHIYFIYFVNIVSICFVGAGTVFLLLSIMYTYNKPNSNYLQNVYKEQSNILLIFSISSFSISLLLFVINIIYKCITH
jgi:hypothetical protein